jgi:predicted AlkP superfamily pyrophosphatase or phosphodiesterase
MVPHAEPTPSGRTDSGALRRWTSIGPSALLPLGALAWFNPDFAGGPLGWLGLGVAWAFTTGLAAYLGSRWPARTARARKAHVGSVVWLGFLLTLVSAIVVGIAGAAVAMVLFALLAMAPVPGHRTPGPIGPARTALASALVCLGLVAATSLARPPRAAPQLILIGVDGATWEIIDELGEAGALPTFSRLAKSGTRGVLDSIEPSISPALWTTIATGRPAHAHGVEDFWVSSRSVRAARIWEVADRNGLTSGVLGYLATWPPEKEGGFLVPGWLRQSNATVPEDLSFLPDLEDLEYAAHGLSRRDLVRVVYRALRRGATLASVAAVIELARSRAPGEDAGLRDLARRHAAMELWTDVFCHLLRDYQPQLGIFYQHHVDAISHLYFAHYRPEMEMFSALEPDERAKYGDAIPRIYAATDRAIGRIEACASPDATILVLSDHGQRPGKASGQPAPMRLLRTGTVLERLDLAGRFRATNVGDQVLLRATRPDEDLQEALAALRSVVSIRPRRGVFRFRDHGEASVLISVNPAVGANQRIRLGGEVLPLSEIVDTSGWLSGTHTDEALLLAVGPDIVPGQRISDGSLLDVAPTALAILGLPVSRELEGRVLEELLRPPALARLSVSYVERYPDRGERGEQQELDDTTRRRLRSLGYLR